MKHLKIFENLNGVWIVIINNTYDDDPEPIAKLFDTEQSAENFVLKYVNEEKEIRIKNFSQNDYILDIEIAYDWLEDEGIMVYLYQVEINKNYKLPEKLERAMYVKKYNL